MFNLPLGNQKSGSCFILAWYNVLPVSHPKSNRVTHRTAVQVCDATVAPQCFNSRYHHCISPLYPNLKHTHFQSLFSPIFAALKIKEI